MLEEEEEGVAEAPDASTLFDFAPGDDTAYVQSSHRVYSEACFEVCRQVSLHCAERGRLLAFLWQGMTDALQAMVFEHTRDLQRIEELEGTARLNPKPYTLNHY